MEAWEWPKDGEFLGLTPPKGVGRRDTPSELGKVALSLYAERARAGADCWVVVDDVGEYLHVLRKVAKSGCRVLIGSIPISKLTAEFATPVAYRPDGPAAEGYEGKGYESPSSAHAHLAARGCAQGIESLRKHEEEIRRAREERARAEAEKRLAEWLAERAAPAGIPPGHRQVAAVHALAQIRGMGVQAAADLDLIRAGKFAAIPPKQIVRWLLDGADEAEARGIAP